MVMQGGCQSLVAQSVVEQGSVRHGIRVLANVYRRLFGPCLTASRTSRMIRRPMASIRPVLSFQEHCLYQHTKQDAALETILDDLNHAYVKSCRHQRLTASFGTEGNNVALCIHNKPDCAP